MLSLIIATILTTSSQQQEPASNWRTFKGTNGKGWYVDISSIELRQDGTVQFWTRNDWSVHKRSSEQKVLSAFNCQNRTMRIETIISYKINGEVGKSEQNRDQRFYPLAPNSVDLEIMKFVCNTKDSPSE